MGNLINIASSLSYPYPFVKENEPPLPQELLQRLQQAEPERNKFEKNDVALVSRREADSEWNAVVYIHKHLIKVQQKLDKFFQHGRINQMYIQGPPGCGKTCFCLLWARLLSVRDRKRVLIVQFREEKSCFIWIRETDGNLWRMDTPMHWEDLGTKVDLLLKKSKMPFDLCVHYGVRDDLLVCGKMISILNVALFGGQIKKVIHVTSLAFSLKTGDCNMDSVSGTISQMRFDSWTYTDYQEALKCEPFREELTKNGEDVLRNDEEFRTESDESDDNDGGGGDGGGGDDESTIMKNLEHKYFYAGGSARFMFMYSIQHVKEELNDHLGTVKQQDWAYFATTNIPWGASSSVNTLMQRFGWNCTPVSKYVLLYAYDKCKTGLVDSVRAAANAVHDNPSLQGWAFELQQPDLIRLSLESVKVGQNPSLVTNQNGLSFCPNSAVDFDGETIQFTKDTATTAENEGYSTVIWCRKWNQGCFDTAFVQDSTLVTLQFTVSEKHSFKPKYIWKLRDALREKGFTVNKFFHAGVTEVHENDFQFIVDRAGTGRSDSTNTNIPGFTVELYHSPRLVRKVVGTNFEVQTNFASTLETVKMWQLTKKRKREE